MTHSTLPATRRLLTLTVLALGLTAGAGRAADAARPAAGDATAGAAKAAACVACHGLNGNSTNPATGPVIAGQNANYTHDQVLRIKAGQRPNPLMQPMVKDLSDQDIADIAAFFANQTPTGNEADPSYWKAGEKLYRGGDAARGIPACSACHGPLGRGNPAAGYPALQAQYAVYTVKQLEAYLADTRYTKNEKGESQGNANAPIMKTIAGRLTAEDRRDLASYIQGIR
jgi:cytochrome c553